MAIVSANQENIKQAAEAIMNGETICFPTDTLYSISANAANLKAIRKIYSIKGRDLGKATSVFIHDLSQIEEFAEVDDRAKKLADKFWPGALMLLLPYKENNKVQELLTASTGRIGVRIPNNKITLDILKQTNIPLINTSANYSGNENILSAKTILETIGSNVSMIIQDDESLDGTASTIIDLSTENIVVIREGSILTSEILDCLNDS